MSFVTVLWSMIAGACVTLALVHLPVGWQKREGWASLVFSLAALCTAVMALCELAMLRAPTLDEYVVALKWVHVPITVLIAALAAFTYLYLGSGRLWLAFSGVGLRVLSTPFNFVDGQTLNFREFTGLRSASLFGEQVSVAAGARTPGCCSATWVCCWCSSSSSTPPARHGAAAPMAWPSAWAPARPSFCSPV